MSSVEGDKQNGHQNGNAGTSPEVRKEVLELNNKRNEIESEIKEYQQILQTVCFVSICKV